jgi:hypothetical protein
MTAALVRKGTLLVVFLAAASLFFFANRPAYQAYFSDDLDKMGWPTVIRNADFAKEIWLPLVS